MYSDVDSRFHFFSLWERDRLLEKCFKQNLKLGFEFIKSILFHKLSVNRNRGAEFRTELLKNSAEYDKFRPGKLKDRKYEMKFLA